jgi:penicillin amidase
MRFLRYLLYTVLALGLLGAVGLYFYLGSKQIDYQGERALPGLRAEVEVLYDSFGIPHIYGQDEEDVYHALGYVHARDRLFQIEGARRLASGQLAEVFGPDLLETDKFFRTLGFRQYARRTIDSAYVPSAPHTRAVRAYVRGVNEFIKTGPLPVEFDLLGIPATEFTEEDVEMISCYMAFSFAMAFSTEPVLTMVKEKYGPAHLRELGANWPAGQPMIPADSVAPPVAQRPAATPPDYAALLALGNRLRQWEQALFPVAPFHGSNGWVLAGRKTASGKPLLANDTHIGFAQPSVFYEAHLVCPGFNFYGNFIGGVPMAVLGHNPHGGWGLTMFENDDVDFYREKPNPQNPNQVWFRDHWEDLEVRQEVIKVKGQPDHSLTVRHSRHGVLLDGVSGQLKAAGAPVALWWTLYQFPSRSIQAFYDLAHARHAGEAAQAAALLHAPGLNIMWADTAGNIAWWAAAKLPQRPPHVDPALLLDGASGQDEVLGWHPFADNPQSLNPASGVVYSANNQPSARAGGLVPGYYVPGDRARRISELLYTDWADWDQAKVRAMLQDDLNPNARDLVRDLLPRLAPAIGPGARPALQALEKWDGTHALAATAPTIYYRFLFRACQGIFADELGQEGLQAFISNHALKRNLATILRNPASVWWDNVATPEQETQAAVLARAFDQAVADLTAQLGADPAQWRWERVHHLTHQHPLHVLPVVGHYFNVGPFAVPGGSETINNLDFRLDSTGLYPVTYGPALRRVVDFGRPGTATSINPTGQSGHFRSPHYADQAGAFAQGRARPELTDRAQIEQAQKGRVVLRPR